MDTDFESRKCIEPLLDDLEFFTANLKPGRAAPGILGCISNHQVPNRALEEITPRTEYGHDKAATGSVFFDRLMKQYPDAKIFEPEIFYPSSPGELENAYAVHYCARSWKTGEGFKASALRAEKRLYELKGKFEKLTEIEQKRRKKYDEVVAKASRLDKRVRDLKNRLKNARKQSKEYKRSATRLRAKLQQYEGHELRMSAKLFFRFLSRRVRHVMPRTHAPGQDGASRESATGGNQTRQ